MAFILFSRSSYLSKLSKERILICIYDIELIQTNTNTSLVSISINFELFFIPKKYKIAVSVA